MPERPDGRPSCSISLVPSPCIRNCCLDENDVCMGCFRTVEEIIAWGGADNGQRRRILENAERRRKPRPSF